jgi:hypothetical protein
MAVQASKSDLTEFIIGSLRDGGRLQLVLGRFCQRPLVIDFSRPRLRAGHPGDQVLTSAYGNRSACELRLNDIRRFCVARPAFCNCGTAIIMFVMASAIAATRHEGARLCRRMR